MKTLLILLALSPLAALACECEHGTTAITTTTTTTSTTADADTQNQPVGHPLKGVIAKIDAERSALLVKHEEIPDVMKAMTMLLKVDAQTLSAAQKDQAITGRLVKKDDGWWLTDVAPAKE